MNEKWKPYDFVCRSVRTNTTTLDVVIPSRIPDELLPSLLWDDLVDAVRTAEHERLRRNGWSHALLGANARTVQASRLLASTYGLASFFYEQAARIVAKEEKEISLAIAINSTPKEDQTVQDKAEPEFRTIDMRIDAGRMMTLCQETDTGKVYAAIGYLSQWNQSFKHVTLLGVTGSVSEITAVYRKTGPEDPVGYTIGAVWNDDDKAFGFHS